MPKVTYNSIGTYDATSSYPEFRGLMQYGDAIGGDPRYTPDCVNAQTAGGYLAAMAKCKVLPAKLPGPIETIARLHRRWFVDAAQRDIIIGACGGKLYSLLPGDKEWTELNLPEGVDGFESNVWSCVSYEINDNPEASVDVLLMSNAYDGMVMVRGDTLTVSAVPTYKKFGVIERYAERIWGGAIIDDPDMLAYSAPFDPTDWEANIEHPEDGAGDINQPSWDGDSFTAIRSFGSQLIAFKKNRVWRILGTDPGEYTFKEQYGGGAPYAGTICVDKERIFMMGRRGVEVYDGLSVSGFQEEYCKDVFARINPDAMDQSCACLYHDNYYLALPLGKSQRNNCVLIYNGSTGSWLLREGLYVEHFLATDTALYYTSSTTPGKLWVWHENAWDENLEAVEACRWVTPWNDLGAKNIVKGGFEVYVLGEVKDDPVVLSISVQTEKKTKTKKLTVQPTDGEPKQKRLHFGGSGRRFRLMIEAEEGSAWRLKSGIMVKSEIDPD